MSETSAPTERPTPASPGRSHSKLVWAVAVFGGISAGVYVWDRMMPASPSPHVYRDDAAKVELTLPNKFQITNVKERTVAGTSLNGIGYSVVANPVQTDKRLLDLTPDSLEHVATTASNGGKATAWSLLSLNGFSALRVEGNYSDGRPFLAYYIEAVDYIVFVGCSPLTDHELEGFHGRREKLSTQVTICEDVAKSTKPTT